MRLQTSGLPLTRGVAIARRAEVLMSKIDEAADKVKDATDKTADYAKNAAKHTGRKR